MNEHIILLGKAIGKRPIGTSNRGERGNNFVLRNTLVRTEGD